MDKRTLTAFLLMFILFLVFNQFVWKPQKQSQQAAITETKTEAAPVQATAPVTADSIAVSADTDTLFASSLQPETIKLSNSLMTVFFNTKGATIQQVELNNFALANKDKVHLLPDSSGIAALKLIHAASETPLDGVVFSHRLSPDSLSVSFYLGDEQAPQIEKRFTMDELYGIKMSVAVNNYKTINGLELDFTVGLADTERTLKNKAGDYKYMMYADNQIQKTALSKLKKTPLSGSFGSFAWAALRSKYFTIALRETEPNLMRSYSTVVNPTTGNPGFRIDSRQNNAKFNWKQDFLIYTGPADHATLKNYGKQMESIPELGASWIRWLSNIFAWFLKFLHHYIRNYGIVLIIFALIIKIITHPLTHKQMEFSFKQQKINPQMQQLQKMYANDRVRLTQEMNKLYKEHNFNPFGCVIPMLIQMPIFYSLFNVLRFSVDMRNASFGLWLKDLSEPDPYMILPIMMSGFMLLQSLMMKPPAMDASQMDDKQKMMQSNAKMMTWGMPIMFFFLFKGFPAGLVLYWTAFNVLSIIHQYYLNKHFKNKENQ